MEIDGEFKLNVSAAEYTVVFFQTPFVEARGGNCLDRAQIGFKHPSIARGLEELCQEAQDPDATFDMLAEGWAIQTMAHLHRMGGARPDEHAKGGLSANSLRRLNEYVAENLDRAISLADLSSVTGLSKRHFIRAFGESAGQTPHRYLVSQRIERAKQLLADSSHSITEIGLAVGFSHAQHFSNKFKALTGLTPSKYRELRLS
jgi:AraC family transcriptional regulator